jgi:hypothetical protein
MFDNTRSHTHKTYSYVCVEINRAFAHPKLNFCQPHSPVQSVIPHNRNHLRNNFSNRWSTALFAQSIVIFKSVDFTCYFRNLTFYLLLGSLWALYWQVREKNVWMLNTPFHRQNATSTTCHTCCILCRWLSETKFLRCNMPPGSIHHVYVK